LFSRGETTRRLCLLVFSAGIYVIVSYRWPPIWRRTSYVKQFMWQDKWHIRHLYYNSAIIEQRIERRLIRSDQVNAFTPSRYPPIRDPCNFKCLIWIESVSDVRFLSWVEANSLHRPIYWTQIYRYCAARWRHIVVKQSALPDQKFLFLTSFVWKKSIHLFLNCAGSNRQPDKQKYSSITNVIKFGYILKYQPDTPIFMHRLFIVICSDSIS
jgi:hypothetical protein